MSELRETNDIIAVIGGKEYPVRFSMATTDAVLDKYPDLEGFMRELTGEKKLTQRETIRLFEWIAALMIETEDGEEFTAEKLAKKLTPAEFIALKNAVEQAIIRDMPQAPADIPVEGTDPKN